MIATQPGKLVLATRGSRLALAQADVVARRLAEAWPGLEVTLEVVSTRGDVLLDRHVSDIGKGAFVKEIQDAVLRGKADVAVHSLKDLPVGPVDGLSPALVAERADARDALVSRGDKVFTYLAEGATLGTSSRRRVAQILRRRSDLRTVPIRGNIETRLRKLDDGEVDAIVLAAAGLERLGLADRIAERFDVEQMVPAAGQGAIAVEHRVDDSRTAELLSAIHDEAAAFEVTAERTCLAKLGGGCNTPIGIHASRDAEGLRIDGIVVTEDGRQAARMWWSGPLRPPEEAGDILAELLRAAGATQILEGASDAHPRY